MAFWRKKRKSTEHYAGDFGSAEINVTKRRGEPALLDIKLTMTAEYAHGLDFQHKRDELGLHHPETLHALHGYAVALGDLPGRRDDAIELLDWLVAARADDQENRLLALNDLTRLQQHSGYLALAEQRLREALSGWERLRGQDDAQTLQIASNLASVLIDLGRREEAEGLMRDTVARRTRTLGATHPDTLSSRNTLAGTLRGSPAQLAEAEHMYRAMLADIDGTTDLTLVVQHNLAAVLTHQGKHAEALKMYRALIESRSQRQGDDHPDTWTSRHNYAVVLNSLGHVTEAEDRLAEVLEGYRRAYGPRHAATLSVQVDLAATRANQGRGAEAVPLLRDAIEGYRSTHGPNHPLVRELTDVLARLGG
ncbi:tetratricopeptide repeat protein [Streptomyces silvisoli]|uniref:Tetratricopeptide repeat protein n=1 Tax=Streptomyces silvisoli TaxID=3034235 RepID=A0ABT5ZQ46_9ACTN|nr:tetratricopeptide repeat protein [Streptomyces silvisoli]MDF3291851.1 tetratricopeptide repeat protein [Streptomyces silvisoli]